MHEPLVSMLFPVVSAHISRSEFQHSNLNWKFFCRPMTNHIVNLKGNKDKLSHLVTAKNVVFHKKETYLADVNFA